MEQEQPTKREERFGVEKWDRGGGHPKPLPAGGKAKKWQPPTKGTTPAHRKKQDAKNESTPSSRSRKA